MQEIQSQLDAIFPEGATVSIDEKNFYTISYKSKTLVETPFGLWPERAFSAGNSDYEKCLNDFTNTLESNGFNFKTKLWQ